MARVIFHCPLCERIAAGMLACENPLAVAFNDRYPVNPGHTLIVPRRHVDDFFTLTEDEQVAIWSLLPPLKEVLAREFGPAGYNVGLNAGAAAGQTVPHVHVHVIPRYPGDVPDPRGGVRWIVPDRADYWSTK